MPLLCYFVIVFSLFSQKAQTYFYAPIELLTHALVQSILLLFVDKDDLEGVLGGA